MAFIFFRNVPFGIHFPLERALWLLERKLEREFWIFQKDLQWALISFLTFKIP